MISFKKNFDARIYVAGHAGLVGSALVRELARRGYGNLILKRSHEIDLRNSAVVNEFFAEERPEYVFLAAAQVGGICANDLFPAQFIFDNLMIQTNVIDASYRYGVKKLLFFGSSCIYPKHAPQPMKEEYLLTGPLETTNEAYAVAKIAGIKMCQAYNRQYCTNFITVMPANLYGPNDNFDPETSHVIPALMRKFHEARVHESSCVTVWGTGTPRREFLHVDDLADACLFLMERYDGNEPINVGTGEDITISELAMIEKEVTGFQGEIVYDTTSPDGTPRKLLDVARIRSLGWRSQISLKDGIRDTYAWYKKNREI